MLAHGLTPQGPRCVNDPSEAPLAKPLSAFASTTEAALADARLRTKVRVGFAFAIFLTCLLSFFSWRMAQQASNEADWVAHTHEVSTVLEATLRHLVDVETGGRGFALTGHASFLDPYETGKSAIGQDLHRLRLLVADNTVQTQRLDILEAEANARIAASTDIVTSRQNTGALPSPSQFERGKPLMDAVRATIAGLSVGTLRRARLAGAEGWLQVLGPCRNYSPAGGKRSPAWLFQSCARHHRPKAGRR